MFQTPFSKIFDKIIYRRLHRHVNCNHILVNEQFDFFRHNRSIEEASYDSTNDILASLNSKLLVGGIFSDLQKAFDCVNHDVLYKMKFHGVLGKAYKLIKSYLKD